MAGNRSDVLPPPTARRCELGQDLRVMAGRGFGSLLRNTNDGNWPPAVGDPYAPRFTPAIE
jgi:hypothetical protein